MEALRWLAVQGRLQKLQKRLQEQRLDLQSQRSQVTATDQVSPVLLPCSSDCRVWGHPGCCKHSAAEPQPACAGE